MKDNKPIVSIVIPCYNHGKFLKEAIESVETFEDPSAYEIIIVNDGSTDSFTVAVLEQLHKEGYQVINQANAGLGAARNAGIKAARGKYILPLDSDNKIRAYFLKKGIEVFDTSPELAIVHGNHAYFGDVGRKKIRKRMPFDLKEIIFDNYIDACAIYRKEVWEDLKGYDANMPVMGHEDWDFWVRAGIRGWKFHYINEILFDYRVRKDSMIHSKKADNRKRIIQNYMFAKDFEVPAYVLAAALDSVEVLKEEVAYFNKKPANYIIKKILNKLIKVFGKGQYCKHFYKVSMRSLLLRILRSD